MCESIVTSCAHRNRSARSIFLAPENLVVHFHVTDLFPRTLGSNTTAISFPSDAKTTPPEEMYTNAPRSEWSVGCCQRQTVPVLDLLQSCSARPRERRKRARSVSDHLL